MLSIGCASQYAEPLSPTEIRISVGTRGGYFDVMGQALVQTLAADQPTYRATLVTTAGAVSAVEALQQGRGDCGFSYANIAYEAFAGRLPDEPRPLNQLRGIALVQISPLHFLVSRQSSIRSVSDLRGRTLAVGLPVSGSFRAARLVLEAYGLDASSVRVQEDAFPASFARLKDGSLEGLLFLAGQPSDVVSRAAESGARVLPLRGAAIDRLREQYPFLRPSLIPKRTYPSQDAPVKTVGVESLLLCRADLDPGHARQVTKAWFVTFNRLLNHGLMSDAVSPKLASAVPIPLHAGAADYYRARQLVPE